MKPNTNQNFTGLAIPLSSNYPILKVTVEKGKKKGGVLTDFTSLVPTLTGGNHQLLENMLATFCGKYMCKKKRRICEYMPLCTVQDE